MRLLRHLGLGVLLGALTGAVARGFMALLTADPEFTWEGTLGILSLFTLAGVALSVAYDLKSRHCSRWWKLLALPAVLVFLGPGLLLVPAVVGIVLLLARTRWIRVTGAAVLVAAVAVLVILSETSDEPFTLRTAAGYVVLLGVCAIIATGARTALLGWTPLVESAAPDSSVSGAAGQAQRDRGHRSDGGRNRGTAEDPLHLHDGGVEQGLPVGLVGQRGDGGVVLVQPDRRE